MKQRRTMLCGDKYEIQERIEDGEWAPICECDSIEQVKDTLKKIKAAEGENDS